MNVRWSSAFFQISAPPVSPDQLSYDELINMHCRWEDKKARERTGHPPSLAEAKKMSNSFMELDFFLLCAFR